MAAATACREHALHVVAHILELGLVGGLALAVMDDPRAGQLEAVVRPVRPSTLPHIPATTQELRPISVQHGCEGGPGRRAFGNGLGGKPDGFHDLQAAHPLAKEVAAAAHRVQGPAGLAGIAALATDVPDAARRCDSPDAAHRYDDQPERVRGPIRGRTEQW